MLSHSGAPWDGGRSQWLWAVDIPSNPDHTAVRGSFALPPMARCAERAEVVGQAPLRAELLSPAANELNPLDRPLLLPPHPVGSPLAKDHR
jgi:hypothetical protein